MDAFDSEIAQGGLLVRGATIEQAVAMGECALQVRIGDEPPIEAAARIAAVVPGVGVAVMFPTVPPELSAAAQRLRSGTALPSDCFGPTPAGEESPASSGAAPMPSGALAARLREMTVAQKMSLALSGDREARFALIRDTNKTLHVYVLRNPRMGIDEVQYAAKLPTLSPEALKLIAEHREWGSNPTICAAVARNPKTPVPIAIRILDRLPVSDLRVIAKGAAREPIVHAARKKLNPT
jgi:hypothetical protein